MDFLVCHYSTSLSTILDLLYCFCFVTRKTVFYIQYSRILGYLKNFQCALPCYFFHQKQYFIQCISDDESFKFDFATGDDIHRCAIEQMKMVTASERNSDPKKFFHVDVICEVLDSDIDVLRLFSMMRVCILKISRLIGAIRIVFLYFNNSNMPEGVILGTQGFKIRGDIICVINDDFNIMEKYSDLLEHKYKLKRLYDVEMKPLEKLVHK